MRVVTTASTTSSEVVTVPTTTTTEEVIVEPTTTTTEAQIASTSIPHPTPTAASRSQESLNWAALRQCESGGDYGDKNNAMYRGAYQFSYNTWASVGGIGDPADASPEEQDQRALTLYERSGSGQWPVCGGRLFS